MIDELADAQLLIDATELKSRIANSKDLIMLPAAAMEAMELANDPDCSIGSFVEVIETDTGLVADILAMSNSAAYGAQTEIKSIHQAVVTIGTTQCQNLIVSSCLRALSNKLPPSVEWSRDVLWRHNVTTATIARFLNKKLRLGFQGEEFSGAMIHDIGRLLIAAAAPDVFEAVDRLSFSEGPATLPTEQSLIGTDHCEVGGEFVKAAGLPDSLVEVVQFHHTPDEACENAALVHLVAAADHMANHLMFAGSADNYAADASDSLNTVAASAAVTDVSAIASEAMQSAEQKDTTQQS